MAESILKISDIQQRLRALGAAPGHEYRVLQAWARVRSVDKRHSPAADFLPKAVRTELPALQAELDALAVVHSEYPGADGAARLLVALRDGQTVESVCLPRDGVCVSTQVGCRFCMTGRDGLLRQLGSAEIVAQVVLARRRGTVKRVVFMGMGEPAHNLDNVLEAIELLGTAGQIGHKNLVFSTVGDRRVFARLPEGAVKPALALSLHSSRADLRAELLPKAPRIDPDELVEFGEAYARATGHPIQYQWTLLAGVNDTEEELAGITRLLRGKYAILNFIPYNANEGMNYRRPALEHWNRLAGELHQRGILTRLRDSAGQDVEGGCGQLRARGVQPPQAVMKLKEKRT